MTPVKAQDLFSLPPSLKHFERFFNPEVHPWQWLTQIKLALAAYDFNAQEKHADYPAGLCVKNEAQVFIHPTVSLPPYGYIEGPVYIGAHCQLRPGVYIRGNVIVGEGSVLGNSCEYKNALLMDHVETAHFNYVGDSILANGAHLGAGAILANLRLDKAIVNIKIGDESFNTELKKIGALLGENVQIGCNAVIQPGTILGKDTYVGSTQAVGGVHPSGTRLF